jgi:hypothetical protein
MQLKCINCFMSVINQSYICLSLILVFYFQFLVMMNLNFFFNCYFDLFYFYKLFCDNFVINFILKVEENNSYSFAYKHFVFIKGGI